MSVIKQHGTLGAYALCKKGEFTWAFMYAPKNTVTGPSMCKGMLPGASGITETVRMSRQSLVVRHGWKF